MRAAALLGLGRANLMARKEYEAALQLTRILTDYPQASQVAEAHFFLGELMLKQENFVQAAAEFEQYLELRPGVIDAYILNKRADAVFATGDYLGAAQVFQAAMASPSTLDNINLQLKLARSYALGGDHDTAIHLYDDASMRTGSANTRALIDLRKGESYTALGNLEQAQAAYMDAITNYPTAYEAYLCLVALVDSGVQVDELTRGKIDYYAGQYGVALAALNRYLLSNPADPGTAYYFFGLTTRALGGYEEAIDYWNKLIQELPDHEYRAEAYNQRAITQWSYLGQNSEAAQGLMEFVQKFPNHDRAAEFLYDAALAAERDNNLEQAAEWFERVLNLYPSYEFALRSIFLSGISHYRLGNYAAAMTAFMRFETTAVSLEDRALANFWIAKTHQAQGNTDAARQGWEKTATIDPTGYYSERARDILHGRAPFTPPEAYDIGVDFAAERLRADEWMRTTFNIPQETDLSNLGALAYDSGIQRGAALWALGLYDEARAEYEQVRLAVQNDPELSYRLLNYLIENDAYRSAIMTARQVLTLASLDDAGTLSAPAYFNHIRFGAYYKDIIFPLAEKYAFHPLFLFSVVRQESLFEGFVRSSADARGLMQVIPATGADIQKNLGWPDDYIADDLYSPIVSLTFGVDYLDTQRENFDGDMYAALAAYNGGPGNSAAWLAEAQNDADLFLEIIRYSETRAYIRGIYEIFSLYRLIYNRTP